MSRMLRLAFIAAVALVAAWIPWHRVEERVQKRYGVCPDLSLLWSRLLFLASPAVSFYIVQVYGGFTDVKFLKRLVSLKGVCNLALYAAVLLFFYVLCNRAKYAALLLTITSSMFGLANYFVMEFRGTPILAADFASLGTAAEVAGNYSYRLNFAAVKALTVTAAFCLMLARQKSRRFLGRKKRILMLAGTAAFWGVLASQFFYGNFFNRHGIKLSVWNPKADYVKNGSLLSLAVSYSYYHVEKPKEYSAAKVEEIAAKYSSDAAQPQSGAKRPHVIAIMNEAFSDLGVLGTLETAEDFMPFTRNLKENTIRGGLYMSIRSSMTADSEFEFLTGCSMAFLPYRSIAYNSYIKSELPSLTTTLKSQGYGGNLAVHPGGRKSWNRNVVYPLLGFAGYVSEEAFEGAPLVHNYVSDEACYEYIERAFEEHVGTSDDPFYLFNVTIQNHGGYNVQDALVDVTIPLENKSEWQEGTEQYLNLVKLSDEAFEGLIGYFAQVEDPVVIVMFGDHQPWFTPSGTAAKDVPKIEQYRVPYVIWANYDIDEQEIDMSCNYLSSYLLDVIGAQMTGYEKYLLDLQKEIPIVTANGYVGADGVLYENGEDSPYAARLEEYRMLQWNNLFDKENQPEAFYELQQP